MDMKPLSELKEIAETTEDKAKLKDIAKELGVEHSPNIGLDTLREKVLAEFLEEEELNTDDPVAAALVQHREAEEKTKDIYADEDEGTKLVKQFSTAEMIEMDAAKIKDPTLRKNVIRAQALRLIRVKITNLDPADADVPGAIVTCQTKYTGKVSKFVPYDEDQHPNGYHLPKIILDDMKSRTYNLRKEVKGPGGSSVGVKKYKTTRVKKFAIEELPPLTREELKELAQQQRASGAIDRSN